MKAMTSALVTRTGVLPTTEKKTFRSKTRARRVLGRAPRREEVEVLIDQRMADRHLQRSARAD